MKHLYIAMICVLLSLASVLGLVGCAKEELNNEEEPPKFSSTDDTQSSDTSDVEDSESNEGADLPSTDNSGSDAQSKPTLPSLSGGAISNYNFSESGSIRSDTGTNLNLYVNWSASSKNGKTMTVKFTVGIESYSIQVGTRNDLGKLKINGETYSFSTSSLTIADNRKKVNTDFYTFEKEYDFEKGETLTFDVIASWVFNGVYGGTELGTLVAGDTVKLKTPL